MHTRHDFEEIKESMIKSYLAQKHISEFAELVDQRITERGTSNVIWNVYMSAHKEAKIVADCHENLKRLEQIAQGVTGMS